MTKTQIKEKLRNLLKKAFELRDEFDKLCSEVEDTRDDIKPYEGCYDLMPEQKERYDWLSETYKVIDESFDNLDDICWRLEDYQ